MKKGPRFDALVGVGLLVVLAALLPAGCADERPGAGSHDAAVISVEPGPAPKSRVESMPRTRAVKEEVNKTMDDEAAKRAKQMDQVFHQ